jgi:hypothetical protein
MSALATEQAYSFCGIHGGKLVYACPKTKAEFDLLPLEVRVHDWQSDKTTTLIKGDGNEWERRCHSKELESTTGITVIFQWWDERAVGSEA